MQNYTQKTAPNSGAQITIIASSDSWIEGDAIQQLETTAQLDGIKAAVGYPDLHPGKGFPIGASFISQDVVYPALAGNDIGCGIGLWQTGLKAKKLKLDKWQRQIGNIDNPWEGDTKSWLEDFGIHSQDHDYTLGTIGGGNHFAELQVIEEILDLGKAKSLSLNPAQCVLMVHSGSRGLGQAILSSHLKEFSSRGLEAGSDAKLMYFIRHDKALKWAKANRALIANRIAGNLRTDTVLISDTAHNLITRETWQGENAFIHRKGASEVNEGPVLLAGSRGTFSYLVQPLGDHQTTGMAIAHGAGRRWQRGKAKSRLSAKFRVQDLERTRLGSRVICENKELIYDEAPQAYKDIESVVETLVAANLIKVIAKLRPVITYKCRRKL